MSLKIHKVLRYEDKIPLEGQMILATTNCGYTALYPAMQMTNNNKSPTENCRHVDICYWALQDWVQEHKRSDTDNAIDGVVTKYVCLVNDVTYINGVASIKEVLWNLFKSYDWGTDSSKPLPSKMVSTFDCVHSCSSNNNNTKSVDGDFT